MNINSGPAGTSLCRGGVRDSSSPQEQLLGTISSPQKSKHLWVVWGPLETPGPSGSGGSAVFQSDTQVTLPFQFLASALNTGAVADPRLRPGCHPLTVNTGAVADLKLEP